jgi:hypothetical protein
VVAGEGVVDGVEGEEAIERRTRQDAVTKQTAAAIPMATYMDTGTGRSTRAPWSLPKNVNQGSLSPVWRNVPMETMRSISSMGARSE